MPLEIVKLLPESERQQCDIDFMAVGNDRLFTSGEGGKIKVWSTEDLRPVGELDANQGGICCAVAHGNRLYAGTSGGKIIVWDVEKGVVVKELDKHEESVLVLRLLGDNILYSGDSAGKVFVWQNDEMIHQYETCEEVWDVLLTEDHLYSVRDRDLSVQKIVQGGHSDKLESIKVVEGRAPLCRIESKIIFLSRDGMDILLLEDGHGYSHVGTIKGHDRMVNTFVCSADGSRIYSGAWDGAVRSFDLHSLSPLSLVELGQPVNILRTSGQHIFVGGNAGLLCKLIDS